jgi:hypothetical protein
MIRVADSRVYLLQANNMVEASVLQTVLVCSGSIPTRQVRTIVECEMAILDTEHRASGSLQ